MTSDEKLREQLDLVKRWFYKFNGGDLNPSDWFELERILESPDPQLAAFLERFKGG